MKKPIVQIKKSRKPIEPIGQKEVPVTPCPPRFAEGAYRQLTARPVNKNHEYNMSYK